MLIDDDGTVLLGDLGVAADLTDDSSHQSGTSRVKPRRMTAEAALSQSQPFFTASSSASPPGDTTTKSRFSLSRPTMGKRKSFVGTVSGAST
jgi:serine/threonine-protein kinase OSR1/STK39